jgi:membrane-associated protein
MLASLSSSALSWLLHPDVKSLLTHGAPVLLFVVMAVVFAESGLLVGFFLPGDSLLFSAGLVVATGGGRPNIALLVAGCFLAAALGDQAGYWFGARIGPALFSRPDSRLFKQEHVTRSHEFFERHGPRALVLARFVPVVRTFTPILAGVSAMRWRVFVTYNLVGAAAWSATATLLGWGLGKHFPKIENYLTPVLALIVAISVLPLLVELRKARRARILQAAPLNP